ncbi:hypothetical protein RINTHM_13680 [Richelia intracellularis HM01]|nr:hypothetical protein RINTHM_13680 [Richelia intracellularis HM01]
MNSGVKLIENFLEILRVLVSNRNYMGKLISMLQNIKVTDNIN